jgi:hypothetical protein
MSAVSVIAFDKEEVYIYIHISEFKQLLNILFAPTVLSCSVVHTLMLRQKSMCWLKGTVSPDILGPFLDGWRNRCWFLNFSEAPLI